MGQVRLSEDHVLLREVGSHYATLGFYGSKGGIPETVVKAIMPWQFSKMSPGERKPRAAEINTLAEKYRHTLREYGVGVSPWYDCDVAPEGHPIHVAPYLGPSVDELVSTATAGGRRHMLRQVLASMQSFLLQGAPPSVGLDSQLSNFCITGPTRQALYIDVFPVLLRQDDGSYLVHWPNPTDPAVIAGEIKRKFDPLGCLRRLRFSLLSIDTRFEDDLLTALEVLGQQGKEFADFFGGLLDTRSQGMSPQALQAEIDRLGFSDGDSFREVALRLVPQGPDRKATLARIFDLSSVHSSHGIPQEERFRDLRILFRDLIS